MVKAECPVCKKPETLARVALIDAFEKRIEPLFENAIEARDAAQAIANEYSLIRSELTQQRIKLLREAQV